MEEIAIRKSLPSDTAFVVDTWLNNFKSDGYFAKRIRHSIYRYNHSKIINHLLERDDAETLIAYPYGDDPDIILGFIVHTKPSIIHYCFVKQELRGMGIGKKLLEYANLNVNNCIFTHWTFAMNDIFAKNSGMEYNPYLIF